MARSKVELIGANIVVLAQFHNPSIVSKEWLHSKGIIEEDVVNFVHTPPFSVVETTGHSLVVETGKWQLVQKNPRKSRLKTLSTICKRYIEALPETPYGAIGLNFAFEAVEGGTAKEEFLPNRDSFEPLLGSRVERGLKAMFESDPFRVTLEVRPSFEGRVHVIFNFHRDVEGATQILSTLRRVSSSFDKANSITEDLIDVPD